MEAAETFSVDVGTAASCRAFGVARSSLYRRRQPPPTVVRIPRASHRALSDVERQEVLDLLHSQRFVDQAPAQVAAALLDEERYLCSARTMYRILDANEEVRERRNQRRHPAYTRPELLATGPNQVWSWDITKLKGPRKWTYFYLYVILDIFSRQVVGWMVADCESASLAKTLIRASCDKQRIDRDQLILHADRGSSMKSKAVALLLSDLGITKSHSRPYVSDDNPFSEAQIKTLKYRPGFPERFGSIQDAKSFCRTFFNWYNNAHYHSGLNWLTPAMVHSGQTGPVLARRQHALDRARRQHPERFVNAPRKVAGPPDKVWINPPDNSQAIASIPNEGVSHLLTFTAGVGHDGGVVDTSLGKPRRLRRYSGLIWTGRDSRAISDAEAAVGQSLLSRDGRAQYGGVRFRDDADRDAPDDVEHWCLRRKRLEEGWSPKRGEDFARNSAREIHAPGGKRA